MEVELTKYQKDILKVALMKRVDAVNEWAKRPVFTPKHAKENCKMAEDFEAECRGIIELLCSN